MKNKHVCAAAAIAGALLLTPVPAAAQDQSARIERLEKELRAVQRKVFPGASGRFFEPEIAPTAPANPNISTSNSAVADLIIRVDALERTLADLTGRIEQQGFRLQQIEDRLGSGATTGGTAPMATNTVSDDSSADDDDGAAPDDMSDDDTTDSSTADAAPDPSRVAGVESIVMPVSDDPGEDAYIYGYRLWDANYYPEAQAQLKKAIADHPTHRRASFARNLLGRAYLDDQKPALASVALYENYQELPRGERAPDSLYFLSNALVQLGKKPDACRVLDELSEVYPEAASGRLSDSVASSRRSADCS